MVVVVHKGGNDETELVLNAKRERERRKLNKATWKLNRSDVGT